MSIEKAIKKTLQLEAKKRGKNDDFLEKQRLLLKLKESGLFKPQSYGIAPLDTIGKRRHQASNIKK